MNIAEIIKDIEKEGKSQRRILEPSQRLTLQHHDVSVNKNVRVSEFKGVRALLSSPRELVARLYRVPLFGYLLNLIMYSLRLPTQIRKIQQDIQHLRHAVSALESRLYVESADSGDRLEEKISSYKEQLRKIDLMGK